MLCNEIMRNEVKHLGPKASAAEVARTMRDEIVGVLPICDERDHVVGIVTDRDIVLRVVAQGRSPDQTPIEEVMSRQVITCRPGDDVAHAAELMVKHQISRMAVTDEHGKLCGVISLTDVAQYVEPIRVASLLRSVSSREFRMRRPGH